MVTTVGQAPSKAGALSENKDTKIIGPGSGYYDLGTLQRLSDWSLEMRCATPQG
jgi:hypothetical protein